MFSSRVAAMALRLVLGFVCVLSLITSALVVFADRSVPTWLPWTEVIVIVGLMAVLAHGERQASRPRCAGVSDLRVPECSSCGVEMGEMARPLCGVGELHARLTAARS